MPKHATEVPVKRDCSFPSTLRSVKRERQLLSSQRQCHQAVLSCLAPMLPSALRFFGQNTCSAKGVSHSA